MASSLFRGSAPHGFPSRPIPRFLLITNEEIHLALKRTVLLAVMALFSSPEKDRFVGPMALFK